MTVAMTMAMMARRCSLLRLLLARLRRTRLSGDRIVDQYGSAIVVGIACKAEYYLRLCRQVYCFAFFYFSIYPAIVERAGSGCWYQSAIR